MVKDITWGQYYSCESTIHALDPRLKIRFTLVYIIMLLLDRNLPLFLFLSGVLIACIAKSRVPVSKIFRGCRGIFLFILVCSAINIFTVPGDVLLSFEGMTVTKEGLIKFGFVFWRMLLLILVSSMLMYTTTPTRMTDGLEKCFHLSGDVAMGMTIALRFIPILFEELDRIMKAQEVRGANFHEGSPLKRVRMLKNVLVPLMQNSIHRAGNLGDAMDARCYMGGKNRSKLNPLCYSVRDVIGYVLLLVLIAVSVWLVIAF